MPANTELLSGITLILVYTTAVIGIYSKLRSNNWAISMAIALAVPTCQSILSVIFQIRFLTGLPFSSISLSFIFLGWCTLNIHKHKEQLKHDAVKALAISKQFIWISAPLLLCLTYTFAQTIFLPQTNVDALTYHLPRVWLFIQNNTFFLDHFTRYHEVIFPVGADILFYPFLALGTTTGLAIFSLSSYIGIGAAAFSISRRYTNQANAALATLIIMSLTEVVLQAGSVKNDIIMANAAIAGLAIALQSTPQTRYRSLLLLLSLCTFGISIKTVFIAYLPGLFLLVAYKIELWKGETLQRLLLEARKDSRLTLILVIPLFIASQIWLFAWNTKYYDGWSGPDEFTDRHTHNDGLVGMRANIIRYGIHSLDSGFITNRFTAPALNLTAPTDALNTLYEKGLAPHLKEVGSSRGTFQTISSTREDFAWFGPLGAFMLFICTPIALATKPKQAFTLLPAALYILIIAANISWMIWNGRFMTTFFISLAPTLAITLDRYPKRWLRRMLLSIALYSLLIVKSTDFNRPLIPVEAMLNQEPDITLKEILRRSLTEGMNIWSLTSKHIKSNPGNPNDLLENIAPNTRVALIGFGNLGHFNFYTARPDIHWIPLNGHRLLGKIETNSAIHFFLNSDINHCAIVGDFPEEIIPYNLARHCADDYGHLITKNTDKKQ